MQVPSYDLNLDELCFGLSTFGLPAAANCNLIRSSSNSIAADTLESRIRALECDIIGAPEGKAIDSNERAAILRARCDVEKKKCYSASWKWVPSNYYDMDLEQRAKLLGAHSKMQLCKALLFENKNFSVVGDYDRRNSQFYLVIVQYGAEIISKSLEVEVRALLPLQERLEQSKYEFRLASADDNNRLTGYVKNSVTPFGLLGKETVPIILASAIKREINFMFMGGGHVDLKLGMAVQEFIRATNAFVLDISVTRS
mmetsp:Transcript_11787/g.15374  ORF Transcript_11787/g.15374 Transcript_11787/m.15374 type:complete len:256 (+) Transcript_11787:135-902(+)